LNCCTIQPCEKWRTT